MPEVYDYVVVGGGMTGCGMVAELLDHRPNASILVIDKLHQLGGHWNFAYPYVRLHNFTSYYTLYGFHWPANIRAEEKHRAGLPELLAYFNSIQKRFEAEKNVTMRFNMNMTGVEEIAGADKADQQAVKWAVKYANDDGTPSEVQAKTLIMATHCRFGSAPPHKKIVGHTSGEPPKQNIYPNQIAQLGDLKKLAKAGKKVAIVGGGKTGADAVIHLYNSGVPMENMVWVKKFDLGFGLRASPQEAFDPPEKRGAIALVPFCIKYRKGIPTSLRVHGQRIMASTLPDGHPHASDMLCYTGGGMLDDDELNLLKKVDQIVGGAVVENAGCVLTLADGTKVEYDWAIWCHGYDPEPYVKVPRQTMTLGMLSEKPGYMAPLNFFSSASQGGRVMGRLLLMHEEGLISTWMKFTITAIYIFIGLFPQNSAMLYAKVGLLESWCAWAISRPAVVARFGWGYMSAMGDMPWFIPGPMKGAKENVFKTIHLD